MKAIYLAGPITGCSYKGCTEWRSSVQQELETAGFEAYSPMRGKEHLKNKKKIRSTTQENAILDNHGVFARDKYDVQRSDIILVNLSGAKQISIGSMMEIAWGHIMNKYVVTVMEENDIHEHLFVLEGSSIIFCDLGEAVQYIITMFGKNNLKRLE